MREVEALGAGWRAARSAGGSESRKLLAHSAHMVTFWSRKAFPFSKSEPMRRLWHLWQ
jgi:hypothetical protein